MKTILLWVNIFHKDESRIYIMAAKIEYRNRRRCCAIFCSDSPGSMDCLNVKNVNRMVANEWIATNGNGIIDNSRILKKRSRALTHFLSSFSFFNSKWANVWMPKRQHYLSNHYTSCSLLHNFYDVKIVERCSIVKERIEESK